MRKIFPEFTKHSASEFNILTANSEEEYKKVVTNRIETAKNYLVSVAERSTGINAYKRWGIWAEKSFKPNSDAYQTRKSTGVFNAIIQLAVPGFTESAARSWAKSQFGTGEETSMNAFVRTAKYIPPPMLDVASWMLMSTTDDLIQFTLYKFAANAATHAALDLSEAAINKIKTFRPSNITLAV